MKLGEVRHSKFLGWGATAEVVAIGDNLVTVKLKDSLFPIQKPTYETMSLNDYEKWYTANWDAYQLEKLQQELNDKNSYIDMIVKERLLIEEKIDKLEAKLAASNRP